MFTEGTNGGEEMETELSEEDPQFIGFLLGSGVGWAFSSKSGTASVVLFCPFPSSQ